MCCRLFLVVAIILAFTAFSSSRKLQNRDDEDLSSIPVTSLHPSILVVINPPRTYILGVLLVVALNIINEPSRRLSSVVAQELLNWEIDGRSAYFLILNEYLVVQVSEQLEQIANKTDPLQIEDLQILVNASTCSQSSSNATVSQVVSVITRLEGLFREASNITLNLGCGYQGDNVSSTVTEEAFESTSVSSNDIETTISERKHHGIARHGYHPTGTYGVSSRDHGEKHHQVNSRDHHSNIGEHHLHTRNHHKDRNAHLQHKLSHDRERERNADSKLHHR